MMVSLFQSTASEENHESPKWPHHYVPFGLSQKNYKELLMPEFVYGYVSILIEHPDHTPQHLLFPHLRDLMRLSVFYQWEAVRNYHSACLTRLEAGRAKWGDAFQEEQKFNILESDRIPATTINAPRKAIPQGAPRQYCTDWNRLGSYSNEALNHINTKHVCAYCRKPDHRIGECSVCPKKQ